VAFTLDQFRLDGKVAIVTGAGGRPNSIGEAYALGLAAAGASVVCADLVREGAETCASRVLAAGGKAVGVQVDIAQEASTNAMAAAAKEAFGGVDILVNNAALMVEMGDPTLGATPLTAPLSGWHTWMNVNLTGALHCARACIPLMLERGGGRIVNQVSAGAYPAAGIYGITKLALVGLTTALAKEVGKRKISVNAIAPGMTASSAGAALTPAGSPFRTYVEATAAGDTDGLPDDLVGALLLLVSPAGRWITGQVLHVDGGLIMTN